MINVNMDPNDKEADRDIDYEQENQDALDRADDWNHAVEKSHDYD